MNLTMNLAMSRAANRPDSPIRRLNVPAKSLVLCCVLWLLANQVLAAEFASSTRVATGFPQFLPVDQAFQFSALQDDEQLLLRWQVAPGYYLYRDRLTFMAAGAALPEALVPLQVALPPGISKMDEYFGQVEVYYEILELTLPLATRPARIDVQYQGCAVAGLCYPPKQQTVILQWAR